MKKIISYIFGLSFLLQAFVMSFAMAETANHMIPTCIEMNMSGNISTNNSQDKSIKMLCCTKEKNTTNVTAQSRKTKKTCKCVFKKENFSCTTAKNISNFLNANIIIYQKIQSQRKNKYQSIAVQKSVYIAHKKIIVIRV